MKKKVLIFILFVVNSSVIHAPAVMTFDYRAENSEIRKINIEKLKENKKIKDPNNS